MPDLSAQGYRLIGGRVLSTMVGPAAMLMYDDDQGGRITLFLQPMRSDVAPMQPVSSGAANGFAWIDGHMGFGVISDGEAPMHGLADHVLHGNASLARFGGAQALSEWLNRILRIRNTSARLRRPPPTSSRPGGDAEANSCIHWWASLAVS
ncbi:MAG: hypothetical protein QOD93_6030 [Acetobacteraceae bacterium]|nr:hypothetical protein [Acetobacteraceae bacterium]